uniref:DUF4455 domain-containing protein n=1 Tax=Toxoplasma gondii (strain ATCC 50861 / VEG) TaxID=432359 RepID=A0A0F7UY48_TOXGV|nr:TPA: hypothetical protein BN1205_020110 [Toxoplasma gondii VEG]
MRPQKTKTRTRPSPKRRTSGVSSPPAMKHQSSPVEGREAGSSLESTNLRKPPFGSPKGDRLSPAFPGVSHRGEEGRSREAEGSSSVLIAEDAAAEGEKGEEEMEDQPSGAMCHDGEVNEQMQRDECEAKDEAESEERRTSPLSFCERLTSRLREKAERVLFKADEEWAMQEETFEGRVKMRSLAAREELKEREATLRALQEVLKEKLYEQIQWRKKQLLRVRAFQERVREEVAPVAEKGDEGETPESAPESGGVKKKDKSGGTRDMRGSPKTLSSTSSTHGAKAVSRAAKTPTHAAGNSNSSHGGNASSAAASPCAGASSSNGKNGRSTLLKGRRGGEEERPFACVAANTEEPRDKDEEHQRLAEAATADLFFFSDDEEGREGCTSGDFETAGKVGQEANGEDKEAGRASDHASVSRTEQRKKDDFWTKEALDENLKSAQQLLREMRVVVTQLAAELEAIEASQTRNFQTRERKHAADEHIRGLSRQLQTVAFHTRGDIERIIDEKCKVENLKLLHQQRAQAQIIHRLVLAVEGWEKQHETTNKKCREELTIHNHHTAIREAVMTLRKDDDFTAPPERQSMEKQMQEKEKSLSVKRHDVIHEALDCQPASVTPEKVTRWLGRLDCIRQAGEAWMRNLSGDFIDLKEIQRRRCEELIHKCAERVAHFNARILWGACETASEVAAQLLEPLQHKHLEELQTDLNALASRMEKRQQEEHRVCLRLLTFLSQVASFLASFRDSHQVLNSSHRRVAMDASKEFVNANRQQASVILALREEMKTAATLADLDALKNKAEEELKTLEGLVRAGVKRIGSLGQSFLPQTQERRRTELAKLLDLWSLAPLSEEQQKKHLALVEEREKKEASHGSEASFELLADSQEAVGPSSAEIRKQESIRSAQERETEASSSPASPARGSLARQRPLSNTAAKALRGGEKKAESANGRKLNVSATHAGSDRRSGASSLSREMESAGGGKGGVHGGSNGDREEGKKRDKVGKREVYEDEIDLDKNIWTDSRGQAYRQLKSFEAMLASLAVPSCGSVVRASVSPPSPRLPPDLSPTLSSSPQATPDLIGEKKKPTSASSLPNSSIVSASVPHRSICSNGRGAPNRTAPATEDGTVLGSPGAGATRQQEVEGREGENGPVEIVLRESWKEGLTRLRTASFDFVSRALEEVETTATALGEAAYSTALGEMKNVLTEFDSTSATVASFSFVYKHRQQQLASHFARLERFLQSVAGAVAQQQRLLVQTEEELTLLLHEMVEEQNRFQQLRLESLLSNVGGSAAAAASSPSPPSPSSLNSKPVASSFAVSALRTSSVPGARDGRLLPSSASGRDKEGRVKEASVAALGSGVECEAVEAGPLDRPGASDERPPDGRIGGCLIQQLERKRKQFVREQDHMRKNAEMKVQFIEQSLIASLQKVQTKIETFFSSAPSISEKELQEANSKRDEWTEEIEKRKGDWQARVSAWKERLDSTATEGRKQIEEHVSGLEDRISWLYGLGRQHGAPKRTAVAAMQHLHQQYEAAIQRCFQCISLSTEQAERRISACRQDLGDPSSPSRYTSERRGKESRNFCRPCRVILTFFEGSSSTAPSPPAHSASNGPHVESPLTKCSTDLPVHTLDRSQLGAGTSDGPGGQGSYEKEDKMGARKSCTFSQQAIASPPAMAGLEEDTCSNAYTKNAKMTHSCYLSLGGSRSTERSGLEAGPIHTSHSFTSVDLLKPHERNALSFAYHVRTAADDLKYQRFTSTSSALPVKTSGTTRRNNNGQMRKVESLPQGVVAGAVSRLEGEVRVSIAQEIRAGYALAGSTILVLCQKLQCLRPSQVSFVDEGAEQILQGLPLLRDHCHSSAEETWNTGKSRESPNDRKNPREAQGGSNTENRGRAGAVSASVNSSSESAKSFGGGTGITPGGGDSEAESNAEQIFREIVETTARTSMLGCLLGSVASLPFSYAAAVEEIEREFRSKAAAAVAPAPPTGGPVARGNGRNDGSPTATGGMSACRDFEAPVYVDHFAQYLRTQAEANRQKLVAVIRHFCHTVREELFPIAVCGIFLDFGQTLQDQLEALDVYLGNGKAAEGRIGPADVDLIRKLRRQWDANLLNLDAQLKCVEETDRLRYSFKHPRERGNPSILRKEQETRHLNSLLNDFFLCWIVNRELCLEEESRREQLTALLVRVCNETASRLNASSAFITNGCIGHFEFLITVLDRLPQLADFRPLDGYGIDHRRYGVENLFCWGTASSVYGVRNLLPIRDCVLQHSDIIMTRSRSLLKCMFFFVSDIPFSAYSMPRRSLKRRLRKNIAVLQVEQGACAQVSSAFGKQNSPQSAGGTWLSTSSRAANSKGAVSCTTPTPEGDCSNYFTKQWRGLPVQPWSLVLSACSYYASTADATYASIGCDANVNEKWTAPVLPVLYHTKSSPPLDSRHTSASSVKPKEKPVSQQTLHNQPVGKQVVSGTTTVPSDLVDDNNVSNSLFSKTITSFSEHRNSRAAGVRLPRGYAEQESLGSKS